jgi:hypothetical protein
MRRSSRRWSGGRAASRRLAHDCGGPIAVGARHARYRWHRAARVDRGREERELMGLARGVIEMRTILGRADTRSCIWRIRSAVRLRPNYLRPGHVRRRPAPEPGYGACAFQADVRGLLKDQPEWWRSFLRPAAIIGHIGLHIATDLLIRDS